MKPQTKDRRAWKAIPGGTALVGYYRVKLGFYWVANGQFFAQVVGGGRDGQASH